VRVVVDSNVVAYYLLGTREFIDEVRGFWSAGHDLLAPALWEAEVANVVWMAARTGVIEPGDAAARLSLAGRLGIHSVATRDLWQGALLRSLHSGSAVYDTLFVELADREGMPLVTCDAKLARAWPAQCRRPRDVRAVRRP
jgi:predicted nucleic acid-binding protein